MSSTVSPVNSPVSSSVSSARLSGSGSPSAAVRMRAVSAARARGEQSTARMPLSANQPAARRACSPALLRQGVVPAALQQARAVALALPVAQEVEVAAAVQPAEVGHCRMRSRYQEALRRQVRWPLAKSTRIRPKRMALPRCHSKLSSSDQTKKPRRSAPCRRACRASSMCAPGTRCAPRPPGGRRRVAPAGGSRSR